MVSISDFLIRACEYPGACIFAKTVIKVA
uniref:cDNA, FLJ95781 n=1 Tax=Homo sapiens TaxID=9606 RepID=B2RBZ8_HUMAN|nr:unnamed protein product [Homo sapiens]